MVPPKEEENLTDKPGCSSEIYCYTTVQSGLTHASTVIVSSSSATCTIERYVQHFSQKGLSNYTGMDPRDQNSKPHAQKHESFQ